MEECGILVVDLEPWGIGRGDLVCEKPSPRSDVCVSQSLFLFFFFLSPFGREERRGEGKGNR